MGRIALPASVLHADLVVSMPKLKTHHWAGMTCSMKNLFGVVPGAVYGWPKNVLHAHGIDSSIVDLVATVRPGLTIVDGIVGMEGDGPIMGTPRGFGVLAMSSDLVAADATCARVLGFDAAKLPYLETAGQLPREPRRAPHRSTRRVAKRDSPLARPCSTSFATGRLVYSCSSGIPNSLADPAAICCRAAMKLDVIAPPHRPISTFA